MERKKGKPNNFFIEGAISAQFIGNSIAKHQHKQNIGAHQIFLGQVRADRIENKKVIGIDYSAYEEMANHIFNEIKEKTFEKFDITCAHIYHSKGLVYAGEICLFVFVSSEHRKASFEALNYIVETLKKEVPVFGKEIFEDNSHSWKVNN